MPADPPFYRLLQALPESRRRQPPVNEWQPERHGEIDIRIDRDGTWYHEGTAFSRLELARLFASILRRDDDGFHLVTPVEKLRIQVEDAPFVAVAVERRQQAGQPVLVFRTNMGDEVMADADHPLWVETDDQGHPRPYLRVRDRLHALIARNVFYDLVALAETATINGRESLVLESCGRRFELGSIE